MERDEKKDKIDHRPTESKDVADALAGVVWGLTRRMEIWHRWKVPVRDIPRSVAHTPKVVEDAKQAPEDETDVQERSEGFKERHALNTRKGRRRR